jgi:hypothetical protein
VDADALAAPGAHRADLHLRGAPRLVAARGGRPLPQLPRARQPARHALPQHGLHARGADAGHGASLLRLLGLPDHRLLRAHLALRHAAGPDGLRRHAAPAGHRRVPRLGALALPGRPARAGALRRHGAVRARGSAARLPPGVEQPDLQLRPLRGARLPDLQRAVLAGEVPLRRPARGRGRVHALSRLCAPPGGVDPQPARRSREPRRGALLARPEHHRLLPLPGRAHDRGGIDRLAGRVASGGMGRAWASA